MKIFAVFAALLLGSCAVEPINSQYHGDDAGILILSLGTIGERTPEFALANGAGQLPLYQLVFRKQGGKVTFLDGNVINYRPGRPFQRRLDFGGYEAGIVEIRHLKPGNYECCYFYVQPTFPKSNYSAVTPKEAYVIPFRIEAGKATYLGSFEAKLVRGSVSGISFPFGVHFVVSDKHERDLKVAQKTEPTLPPVTISVPDVSTLGIPILVSTEPTG